MAGDGEDRVALFLFTTKDARGCETRIFMSKG